MDSRRSSDAATSSWPKLFSSSSSTSSPSSSSFRKPLLSLCLVSFFIFFTLIQSAYAAPGDYVGPFDPVIPGAYCVNTSEVASFNYTLWDVCGPVVSRLYSSVYIDSFQAARLAGMRFLIGFAQVSSDECKTISLNFGCTMLFRECKIEQVEGPDNNNTTTNYSVPVASTDCLSVCRLWSDTCATQTQGPPPGTFDCDNPLVLLWGNNSNALFPSTNQSAIYFQYNTSVGITKLNTTYSCNTPQTAATLTQICPSPLYYDPNEPNKCSLGCPLPLISDDEYHQLETMMSVLGWLSFILTAFLMASYAVDPQKRKYPAILPLFFIFCINATSFAFCLGSMVGHEDVWCETEVIPYDFGGGACTVQGMIWVYFTMAGVMWWLCIALNMMVMVAWPRFKDIMTRWYHVYHVIWLFPILTLIISLANEKLGYGGDVWCSVHIGPPTVSYTQTAAGLQTQSDDTAYLWNLLLMIVPILVMIFVGMCALGVVMVYIFLNVRELGWKYLIGQWRLLIFISFYIYIYVFVFAFQIELIVQKDDQYYEYQLYISCVISQATLPSLVCELDQKVSYPLWFIVVFNAAAQGVFIWIIFGTTLQVYRSWFDLFTCNRWKDVSTSGGRTPVKIEGMKWTGTLSASQSSSSSIERIEEEELRELEEMGGGDDGSDFTHTDPTTSDEEGEGGSGSGGSSVKQEKEKKESPQGSDDDEDGDGDSSSDD